MAWIKGVQIGDLIGRAIVGIIGLGILFVAIQGFVIMPLVDFLAYRAETDPKFRPAYETARKIRAVSDPTSPHSPENVAGLLSGPMLIVGVCLLFARWTAYTLWPGVALVTFGLTPVLGHLARANLQTLRRHPAPEPGVDGQTQRLPGWGLAAGIAFIWTIAIHPWAGDGAAPAKVAVCSALASGVSWLATQYITMLRRRRSEPAVDFKPCQDLCLILNVVGLASLVFYGLNSYLNGIANAATEASTVHQVLGLQATVADYAAKLKSFSLGMSIVVVVVGMALLALGRGAQAATLMKARNTLAKVLKMAGTTALAVGSFSLAGAAEGSAVTGGALARLEMLRADGLASKQHFLAAVEKAIAAQAIESEVDTKTPQLSGRCGIVADDVTTCETALTMGLSAQKAQADTLTDEARQAGFDTADADLLEAKQSGLGSVALSDALDRKLTADPAPPFPGMPDVSFDNIPVANINIAAQGVEWAENDRYLVHAPSQAPAPVDGFPPPPEPVGPAFGAPSKDPLHSLVGLALDTLVQLSPVKFELPIKASAGGVVSKLSGVVTDAVRTPFQDAVRDTAVALIKACAGGTADCRAKVRNILDRSEADPRVHALARTMAPPLDSAISGWIDSYANAKGAVAKLQMRLDRAIRPAMEEAARTTGEKLIEIWKEQLGDRSKTDWLSSIPPETVTGVGANISQFSAAWDAEKRRLALEAAGQHTTMPPGGWNRALLAFISQKPDRAPVFAMMMHQALPQFRDTQPDAKALQDLFRQFASAAGVDPKPFSGQGAGQESPFSGYVTQKVKPPEFEPQPPPKPPTDYEHPPEVRPAI